MDRLTHDERKLAWDSCWNTSFAGIAIIDAVLEEGQEQLLFRSANPQFCKILGVSPAEIIGQDIRNVTPNPTRSVEFKNLSMIKDGLIESFMLKKMFEIPGKDSRYVVSIVRGALDSEAKFRFFVMQIMLDDEVVVSESNTPVPQSSGILDFIKNYQKIFVAIGTGIAACIYTLLEYLKLKGK